MNQQRIDEIKARDKAFQKSKALIKKADPGGLVPLNDHEANIFFAGFMDGWRESREYFEQEVERLKAELAEANRLQDINRDFIERVRRY